MKPVRVWITRRLGPPVTSYAADHVEPRARTPGRFDDVKKKPFTHINPNGRTPAIEDPNTGLTLWESGAIIQYLIEKYDIDKTLTYDTFAEKQHLNQWLQFQMSGQGPYYGVAAWFNVLHQEKIPSAIERYNDQLRRVLGVLNQWLEGRQWLVGDKITYADLAFAPWNDRVDSAWHERMTVRPAWQRAMKRRSVLMGEQGLQNDTGRPARFKSHQEYEEAIARGENTDA
ncbi:uncharacterized protein JN550_010025 [Neoarthrinium moseri]|uniref:uncharacterized protein n=1 Tax=Neoarthrinium moseri TaxID=1658444 RepID=UPI001FDD3D38|nr:uncharacterized protein JN550_010025 [Neoarthrinium moseri]KAI1862688.1 hypothetical protein JN550_010025 [Neoarthrinium moseri]